MKHAPTPEAIRQHRIVAQIDRAHELMNRGMKAADVPPVLAFESRLSLEDARVAVWAAEQEREGIQ